MEGEVGFFLSKPDAILADELTDIAISDFDWNNSISRMTAVRILVVTVVLELDLESWDTLSFEIANLYTRDNS